MSSGTPSPEHRELEDEVLALRSRDGDVAAFEQLARRFQHRVYSYALRMAGDAHEAEDLTQEVLLRAFRSLERFDAAQRLAPWLFGIAAHVCRDWLRRKCRRRERLQEGLEELATVPPSSEAVAHEQAEIVRRAVRRLPLKYREVIVLHYLENRGYDEVAASLGIRPAAARRRALRAREMLRRTLARSGVLPEGR
jgi:RNA polymerase sigma-70 factor (ECF subfamily)